ncbi:putative enolase [Thalictrum thalictroides]|uniref:Putative enolase n=1 Tax=Thalictrum thalictroides TaxID=46969 RepID=A0A7J6V6Q7_THATH|nr:putative enolase [Thalictrum thalictroides]
MLPNEVEGIRPGRHMGYSADLKKSSRYPQTSRSVKEKISSAQADQIIRLQEQLKLDKPTSKLNGDLRHEVKQTLGEGTLFPQTSAGNHQKQSVGRKEKDDELVKHMSNLPRYLQRVERGENVQEKVLNFGVLDWERLEQWKHNQKPVTHRSVMYSPSSSSTSSPFSTVGSSTLSTGSDSGILAQTKQSPARSAHVASSSKDCYSVGVKPTRANVVALQDKNKITASKNALVGQQKFPGTNDSSQKNHSKTMFEKNMKGDLNLKFTKERETSMASSKSSEVSYSLKGKTKVPEGEYAQKREKIQDSTSAPQHCPGRDKTIVLLLPKDLSRKRFTGPSRNAEFTALNDNKQTETARSSFSDGFCINEEVHFSELYSDVPRSCPQFLKTEPRKQSEMNLHRSVDSLGSKAPSKVSRSLPHSGEMHTVRSEHRQPEENKSTTEAKDLVVTQHSKESGLKTEKPPPERRGNLSPIRWPSVGRGKVSRSLSFKEASTLPPLHSTYHTVKSGPVGLSASPDGLNKDKSTTKSRNRSSPLRRLLDPLLGPKTASHFTSVEPSAEEAHSVCKPSHRPLPSSIQPTTISTNFSGSIAHENNGSQLDQNHAVSMVQALLQVTVKNGLPWFTFAVDNNSDILAATMRKTNSSEKYDCSWIYTFYSFRKSKKKSGGWMVHGGKAKSSDYVPNVVGQLKVNGSRRTKSTKSEPESHLMVREFVLLDVEPRKADQETANHQSNLELAAIVIKVPKETTGCLTSDRQQKRNHEELSHLNLPERFPNMNHPFSSRENLMSEPIVGSQNLSSIVVVLPSGVHGLPASGSPSPLLDRWKSGGSCDCGGWDVGCQLRILSSQDQNAKSLDSTTLSCAQDKFDLFIQGRGSQECIPPFSFATYNKGVHSIDFNASMSSLQAFSICIAFLHCKNLAEVSHLFQEITVQEPISMESERIKLSTQFEGKTPSSCAPFPPPSPVGRA